MNFLLQTLKCKLPFASIIGQLNDYRVIHFGYLASLKSLLFVYFVNFLFFLLIK